MAKKSASKARSKKNSKTTPVKKASKTAPAKKAPKIIPAKKAAKTAPSKQSPKKVTSSKKSKKTVVPKTTDAPVVDPVVPKTADDPIKIAQPKKQEDDFIKGYTPDQYAKIIEEKKALSNKSSQFLKDQLKKNGQTMSGDKGELISKVADGRVLGRIPRCPKCFGGRPRFDYKTGNYTCPGYRDDEDYQNCHKVFQKSELKRDPWQ